MRTTAGAPTALAKRWTVRMDGVPLPLSMRASSNSGACTSYAWRTAGLAKGTPHQPAKYSPTRSEVQVATLVPKKSASSVHTGQPIAMAQAKIPGSVNLDYLDAFAR